MLSRTPQARHIHKWQLYTPEIDLELEAYLGVAVEQSQWTFRKCDCRVKMRCKAASLTGYAPACRPYADEEWEPVP